MYIFWKEKIIKKLCSYRIFEINVSNPIRFKILFLNIHCRALKQHCKKIVENNAYCPTFLIVSSYSRRALLVAIKNDSCWGLQVFC